MAESAGPNDSDNDPVAELHREMSDQLRRLAWAIVRDWQLADDALQDAFLLLATKCCQIPPQQRRGWLVRCVQYSAMNLRRTRARQDRLVREESSLYETGRAKQANFQSDFGRTESNALEFAEQLELVRGAVRALPPEQQLVVRQRLIEEKTFQEIADSQRISLGTVLSRMRLAMEKLRRRLK